VFRAIHGKVILTGRILVRIRCNLYTYLSSISTSFHSTSPSVLLWHAFMESLGFPYAFAEFEEVQTFANLRFLLAPVAESGKCRHHFASSPLPPRTSSRQDSQPLLLASLCFWHSNSISCPFLPTSCILTSSWLRIYTRVGQCNTTCRSYHTFPQYFSGLDRFGTTEPHYRPSSEVFCIHLTASRQ